MSAHAESVLVSGRAERELSLTEIAGVLQYIPDEYTTIRCAATSALGPRSVVIPADLYRATVAGTSEIERQMAFAAAMRRTTIDGEPAISTPQFRKLVTCAIPNWMKDPVDESAFAAAMKAARRAATVCGDIELETALRTIQGWRRSVLAGHKRDPAEIRTFSDFSTATIMRPTFTF